MNSITVKNNTLVTLHLDDEERGSKRLAPYSELHGDDTSGFHRVPPPPHAVKCQVGLYYLIILSSKLLEDGVQHQVDDSAAVDEHPRIWLPIDVTPNIQQLQVLV
jgi:hypothetical protein